MSIKKESSNVPNDHLQCAEDTAIANNQECTTDLASLFKLSDNNIVCFVRGKGMFPAEYTDDQILLCLKEEKNRLLLENSVLKNRVDTLFLENIVEIKKIIQRYIYRCPHLNIDDIVQELWLFFFVYKIARNDKGILIVSRSRVPKYLSYDVTRVTENNEMAWFNRIIQNFCSDLLQKIRHDHNSQKRELTNRIGYTNLYNKKTIEGVYHDEPYEYCPSTINELRDAIHKKMLLQKRKKGSNDTLGKVLRGVLNGLSPTDIATKESMNEATVIWWLRVFRQEGERLLETMGYSDR
jgi:DNA-directed RNA polymerase specialized sigma24 family protein